MLWVLAFILFIVFLILKLNKNIDWSWWWVTSPLWISFILWFVCCLIAVVITSMLAFILY